MVNSIPRSVSKYTHSEPRPPTLACNFVIFCEAPDYTEVGNKLEQIHIYTKVLKSEELIYNLEHKSNSEAHGVVLRISEVELPDHEAESERL